MRAEVHRALGALLATTLGAAALALLPAGSAQAATTYWVSTTGNDKWTGTSSKPWRTIAKAVATAPAGAVIAVRSGTYAPFAVTKTGQSVVEASGANVVVQGARGYREVVRVTAAGVRLQDLTVTGCVPDPTPSGGFETGGSSGVRIESGAADVVVQGLTVSSSRGTNSYGLPFGCYGIAVQGANGTVLRGNDIWGNGAGIWFNGGGKGALVQGNNVHDNDVIIRNTPGGNDDFGGGAVAFTNITAAPGPEASVNVITRNAGPSSDYVADGGAFEIYNASNVSIHDNQLAENENVLETGTGAGGACRGNTFYSNTAVGRPEGSRLDKSVGMILRCATGMTVHHNTFTMIDWWVFTLEGGDPFATNVRGLSITDNTIHQWQKVYHLGVDAVANEILVDRNTLDFTGPIFSSYVDGTTSPSAADWQTRTGLDANSTTPSPPTP